MTSRAEGFLDCNGVGEGRGKGSTNLWRLLEGFKPCLRSSWLRTLSEADLDLSLLPLEGAGSDLDGRGACSGVPGGVEGLEGEGGDPRRARRAKGFSTTTSIRPWIFFLVTEGDTNEEEVEGAEMGVLLGGGVGVGGSERGAGVGGAKGLPGVEGRGSEAAASASHSSYQSETFWGSESFSVFFCFFASFDFFFLRAFLAFLWATRSSSVIVRMSVESNGCRESVAGVGAGADGGGGAGESRRINSSLSSSSTSMGD